MLSFYVELVAAGTPDEAASRDPGVAAHLAACAPCFEDHQGLLAAVAAEDRA